MDFWLLMGIFAVCYVFICGPWFSVSHSERITKEIQAQNKAQEHLQNKVNAWNTKRKNHNEN